MAVYKYRKHWNTSVSTCQLLDYNMLYISLAVCFSDLKIQGRIILVLIFSAFRALAEVPYGIKHPLSSVYFPLWAGWSIGSATDKIQSCNWKK